MANVNIPYSDPGQAAFEVLDTWENMFLLSGAWPALSPGYPLSVKAAQVLKQFHVVGLDAAGLLVPATYNADPELGVKAMGVVTQAVVGAAGNVTTVPVFYAGCFNPEALVWDASFDTEAKKLAAFTGAPTPTQIVVRTRG